MRGRRRRCGFRSAIASSRPCEHAENRDGHGRIEHRGEQRMEPRNPLPSGSPELRAQIVRPGRRTTFASGPRTAHRAGDLRPRVPPRAVGVRATSPALVGDPDVDPGIHVVGAAQPVSERGRHGRPVYGMGGLDGLGGRAGGQETTSGTGTDSADVNHNLAKVRVAGSNPVVRSVVRSISGLLSGHFLEAAGVSQSHLTIPSRCDIARGCVQLRCAIPVHA